jgi:muramoyltetrapeptide carboxypeptidase
MGSKAVVRPPRLAPGSRVALVAPAGPLGERDDLSRAIELCQLLGLVPAPGEHVLDRYGYLAGSDDARAADLNTALEDPTIDAVWCLRGGYGVSRILDRVNYGALARWPKAVIGFSDITALLLAIRARTGLVAFHGPMSRAPLTSFSRAHFEQVLRRPEPAGVLGLLEPPAGVLVPRSPRIVAIHGGAAEGPLVGGNLTLLMALAGTPDFPDLDGALLFLEDVGEDLYRVDRLLAQLRMMGGLARLAGVVVGQFTDMKKGTDGGGALAFDEVLHTYLGPLGIPVAYGFPIGHVDDQWTMPLGVRARLDADQGTVELLEAAVG